MKAWHFGSALAVAVLTALTAPLPGSEPTEPPVESLDRPPDQTFLTYPEWFLVFSPAEHAHYLQDRPPSDFPYLGHVGQYWEAYNAVSRATEEYPFNSDYHTMMVVIGSSASVEYSVKVTWERLVGRFTEALRTEMTPEDHAIAASWQRYVDFIEHTPFYKYDYLGDLRTLWALPVGGHSSIRRWERRFSWSSELLVKAAYARLIASGTAASFTPAQLVTRIEIESPPPPPVECAPYEILAQSEETQTWTVPRYQPFTACAVAIAEAGADFRSVAGNQGEILMTLVVAEHAEIPLEPGSRVLFEQPVLTSAGQRRVALVVPIAGLASTLRRCQPGTLEHIFDF